MHIPSICPSVVVALCGLCAATWAQSLNVPLRVEERADISRSGEWIQTGVPLPREAQITEASGLSVLDASGAPVDADFAVTERWGGPPDDETLPIRWLLVSLSGTIEASASRSFRLVDYRPDAGSPSITIDQTADLWTIDTGAALFEIALDHFDLFHRVKVSGHEILSPDPQNGPYYQLAGATYRAQSSRGRPTGSILRQGVHKRTLTIRIQGAHRTGDDTLDEDLDYATTMTFFAGTATVLVRHTVQNNRTWVPLENNADFRDIGSSNSVEADEIGLRLALQPGGTPTWSIATDPDTLLSGPLAQDVSIYQDSSGDPNWDLWKIAHDTGDNPVDHPLYSPASYVSFRGYRAREGQATLAHGEKMTGWLDLSGTSGGLSVAVRDFWQNFPNALRARSDAVIDVALFPDDFRARHSLRVGEQKTHEILFVFHQPDDTNAAGLAAGFQKPLMLLAPPSWYAQICRVIPTVATTTARRYRFDTVPANGDTQVDITPGEWDAFMVRHLHGPGLEGYSFDGMDEVVGASQLYGWMDFGDVPIDFEDENACGSSSVARSITGQYGWKYDGDQGLLMNFLRSQDPDFLDYALAAARHTADLDIMHHGRQSGRGIGDFRDGGMFGHEQHDQNGDRNPHRNGNPFSRCGSEGWNGTPTADMIYGVGAMELAARLTGDPTFDESIRDIADWTVYFAANFPQYTQGRGAANALNTLAWAWQATGEASYRAAADQVIDNGTVFHRPLGGALLDVLAADALGRWVFALRAADDTHLDDLLAVVASGAANFTTTPWDFLRGDAFAWAALVLPRARQELIEKADRQFASAVRNPASWPDPPYGIQRVWQIKEWVLSLRGGHPYQLATYDRRGGPRFEPGPATLAAHAGKTLQNSLPHADIAGGADIDGRTGEPILFDGSASSDAETPAPELFYLWEFSDGRTATEAHVEHTFEEPGEYLVRLYVSDGEGVAVARQRAAIAFVDHAPKPDAGPDRIAPTDAALLFDAGASSDPDGQPMTYTWSFGDGTQAGGVQVTHTYTRAGAYDVLLTASDGKLVAGDAAHVRILEPGEQRYALVLRDGLDDYAGARDVRIWSKLPEGNYGGASELYVGRQSDPELQSLLAFSLDDIPAGAMIEEATISLYVTGASTGTIDVHRVTTPWVEGTGTYGNTHDGATWATSDGESGWKSGGGADFDAAVVDQFEAPGAGVRVTADVTSLVQYWLTGTDNAGLVLNPRDDADFWAAFLAAREAQDASTRPELNVTFRPLRGVSSRQGPSTRCKKLSQAGDPHTPADSPFPRRRRPQYRLAQISRFPSRVPVMASLPASHPPAGPITAPAQQVHPAGSLHRTALYRRTVRLGPCAACTPATTHNTKVMASYADVQWWSTATEYIWSPENAILHRWDLSTIPARSHIVSARIVQPFFTRAGWDRTELGTIAPILDPDQLGLWDETRVTWNERDNIAGIPWTAGGGALPDAIGAPLSRVYYEPWNSLSWGTVRLDGWDATELVRTWLDDPTVNDGIAFLPLTSSVIDLPADRYPDAGLRPYLEITYATALRPATPPQVDGLRVTHDSGRTVITWNEIADPGGPLSEFSYRLYRSRRPIGASNLRGAARIAKITRNGTGAAPLRDLAEGDGPHNWAVREGEGEIPDGIGLYVYEPHDAGTYYYAVTYALHGQENDQDFTPGSNSTLRPLDEVVGDGRPVLQKTGPGADGRTYRIYAFWPGDEMANDSQFAYPFRITLPTDFDPAAPYPLYFVLGGYSTTYMSGDYSFDGRDVLALYLETRTPYYDWMNGALTDWFLGYRDNLASLRSPPSAGTVRWYGIARTLFLLDWLAGGSSDLSIDVDQAYLWGGSQGGAGALFTGMLAPEPWAAIKAAMPVFNFANECPEADCWNSSGTGNWTKNTFGVLFGRPEDDLYDERGISIWAALDADRALISLVEAGGEPPPMLIGHAWNDTNLWWDEDQGAFIDAALAQRIAMLFQWDDVGHNEQVPGKMSATRRSLPAVALTDSSLDDTPPPPWAGLDGIDYGTGALSGWHDGTPGSVVWHLGADLGSLQEQEHTLQVALWVSPSEPSNNATADVTVRRAQIFRPPEGASVSWENRDDQGQLIQSGTVAAGPSSRVTILDFQVTKTGNTLVLTY